MTYIYHYHATYQKVPGEIGHSDGIITGETPIDSYERYQATKKNLEKTINVPEINSDKIIVESLTLLHTF
jgi:hypothetical protein